jgi:hypothetical protein
VPLTNVTKKKVITIPCKDEYIFQYVSILYLYGILIFDIFGSKNKYNQKSKKQKKDEKNLPGLGPAGVRWLVATDLVGV